MIQDYSKNKNVFTKGGLTTTKLNGLTEQHMEIKNVGCKNGGVGVGGGWEGEA